LLPHLRDVVIEQVEHAADRVQLRARATATLVPCTTCGTPSGRVHSRYQRRVNDLTVGGQPVMILLRVRRLFCPNPDCTVLTFAEQVTGLTAPYRRRSLPLLAQLHRIALALAGRAGARLAAQLGMPVHRTTLLRLVRALPDPLTVTPAVLGVDDFALRRGHVYGTILVDLDTGAPIELLAGRAAEPLAAWLNDHPGVEVICRDRAGAYAEGAAAGAPDATQVADRWHLWRNLGQHAEKAVARHRGCLTAPAPDQPSVPEITEPAAPPPPRAAAAESRLVVRTRDRYTAVQELLAAGSSLAAICRTLRLDRKTVQRFARAATVEELLGKATGRSSLLDGFKPYLHQRWSEGVTDAAQLTSELVAMGYTGSEQTVRRYVRPWRAMTAPPPPPPAAPTVRTVTGWLLRHPDTLDADEHHQLKEVRTRCEHLDRLADYVKQFAQMLTNRHGHRLHDWLGRVEADDIAELRSFAAGVRRDQDAVTAGLTLPYSSGGVEGSVNRLKMLKRQMYGRAKLDLLRKRVVLAA
jgi:transposase